MRHLAALALVACSSPARAPEPVRPVVVAQPPVAKPEPRPIPTLHADSSVREAPHGGAIQTLALAPDGQTAISADELGGVRLWPALDGSAEPKVIDMPPPKQLAVGRFGEHYAAVSRDEAGGLYIAKLDANGRQVSHTSLPAEPVAIGIAMTELGLLAWRADQTVVLVDRDGVTLGKLGTEPQQRIVAVAVNGKRAVVVLDREGTKRQARWLTLAPKLAWGAWLALDTELGSNELAGSLDIALSPNGKRVATLSRLTAQTPGRPSSLGAAGAVAVFDIATGKARSAGAAASATADIGFIDDDHVAIGGFEGMAWIDLTAATPKPSQVTPTSPGSRAQPALATGGGRAITAMNGDLVLSTPSLTQFLGYETVSPRIAEVGPNGQLLVGVGDHLVLLDNDLRANASTNPFTNAVGQVAELRWIGEDDWLLESTTPSDATLQISLVSPRFGTAAVRKGIKEVQILGYEPSTQLVTLSFGAESEVARLDRKKRQLDRVAGVKKASPYEQVMFLPMSPSLARGTQLVQVTMKERSVIKWLRDASALDKPSATVTVEGPFAGANAAGQVFMWRNTPTGRLELVLYADGKPVRTLPNIGAITLSPEPSGKSYVEIAPSSVALYDITGKQLWFQQLATSQEAH
ncbi:MAG TPA: hypothetical protein VIV11_37905, partial [Kofleriaceae bacterium]